MKSFTKIGLLTTLLIALPGLLSNSSLEAKTKFVRFDDKISSGNSFVTKSVMPSKSERSSNNKGFITLEFDSSVPEEFEKSLEAACDYWASIIPAKYEVLLFIESAPLDADIATKVEVAYDEDIVNGAPMALSAQIKQRQEAEIDGIITFNSELDWNSNLSSENSEGMNVYTMTLRAIATTLGFGSSISKDVEDNIDKYWFMCFGGSRFDKQVHKDVTYMTNFSEYTTELEQFILSDNIYVKGEKSEHKLYSSNPFIQSKSLVYLDDPTSLMHYDIGEGDKYFSIDDNTIDILRGIGWSIASNNGPVIVCDEIKSDGIGSAYRSYTFSLSDENASNLLWTYSLKDKSGKFVTISTESGSAFTISAVEQPKQYYTNINGDLEGKIECEYTLNGERISANPFTVSLEMAPEIIHISEIEKKYVSKHDFYATFTVEYTGTSTVWIDIYEGDTDYPRTFVFSEPYIAHIKTDEISDLTDCTINVYVGNDYGFEEQAFVIHALSTGVDEIIADNSDITIYDIYGSQIYSGNKKDFNKNKLIPGIYIEKSNDNLLTHKFVVR